MSEKPIQPAPVEKPRPTPLPPNVADPSSERLPDDVPRWKPDYSEFTKK